MNYDEINLEERKNSYYPKLTRNSIFWKEGKMLLHKNGIIIAEDGTYIVFPNNREQGKKIISTSLQNAFDYLLKIDEIKEGE